MEKWKVTRIMLKENYQNRIKELPESVKQFVGLVIVTIIIISFFFILNVMFGEGNELVEKMKIEFRILKCIDFEIPCDIGSSGPSHSIRLVKLI